MMPRLQFHIKQYRFSAGLIPLCIVVIVMAVMLKAGFWQLGRAAEKQARQQQYTLAKQLPAIDLNQTKSEAAKIQFHKVTVQGRFLNEKQFLLDNRVFTNAQGAKRVGYEVLTPFITDAGKAYLVNRGWVAALENRQDLPEINVDANERMITGIINNPGIGFNLGEMDNDQHWPRVIQYTDFAVLSERLQTPVYPALIMLADDNPQAYRQQWQPVIEGPEKHYSYAAQWFAMSTALILLFTVACVRRGNNERDNERNEK